MIWLIKFLIFGHAHKWETIKTEKLSDIIVEGAPGHHGSRYICRCTKCGSIRKFDCF
jgi:hypothetical protein